ncbi:peptidase M61 [Synechococcus sp. Nb3U1]|uniref:M61 family metallopeptidase n=1 Tax=Synechococcus sp. Nb3U1 TaxID=1914529 RepID=UPI001F2835AB|nr:peptidase M61 [Synechococcus sp. Nb3U1]MCF2970097.1 peptidase M61 [Synechococcus sp. Nb3U1]
MVISEAVVAAPLRLSRQHFTVRMPEPANHLFEVELQLREVEPEVPLRLRMPVWTPGSYLVREYARHVQEFRAENEQGIPLPWRKIDKNTWQIRTPSRLHEQPPSNGSQTVYVRYRVYAYELTVRTNHLDLTHGYFNGAALFLYVPGREQEPHTLTVIPPKPDWRIATSLRPLSSLMPTTGDPGLGQSFVAQDYDELVDSPVEVGLHRLATFEVEGIPHSFVVWGEGNLDLARAVADTQRIVTTTANFFGGLPYDRYWFIVHLSPEGFGGLEHKCSTTLNYSRLEFHQPEKYQRFLSLVAHEFFHTWNVKRLRPLALERFDYNQENYLECLWFCEGATSYYESVILLRAGILTPAAFLKTLSEQIARLQRIPGRAVQSLSESSFDTWIKLYRPHENTLNSQVSYYLKGALVCWLLDLHIRQLSGNRGSLDTALRDLWQRFGKVDHGYSEGQLREAFERAAGAELSQFFAAYVDGTQELDYDTYLQPFGLSLKTYFSHPNPSPYLGLNFNGEGNRISSVDMGSPAQRVGIWAGDELLAVEGFKVSAAQLPDRLRAYQPHQVICLSVFQAEQLKNFWIPLDPPRPDGYSLEVLPTLTLDQQQLQQEWLGVVLKL